MNELMVRGLSPIACTEHPQPRSTGSACAEMLVLPVSGWLLQLPARRWTGGNRAAGQPRLHRAAHQGTAGF